jgi:hypothetical protein
MSNITEEHLKNLTNVELNYKAKDYPKCKDHNLPKLYWLGLWIGSKNSGKTYSVCKLIRCYEKFGLELKGEKVGVRTILISPTHEANPTYTALKSLDKSDIHEHYSHAGFEAIIDDIKEQKEATQEYKEKMALYKKFMKVKKLEELSHDELIQLYEMNFTEPKAPRYKNFMANFLIIDDMLGSNIFRNQGESPFNKFCIACRHIDTCVCILLQNLKACPRSLRMNCTVFVVFRFASKKVITEDLYEEIANTITQEVFEEVFEYATKKNDHDSLVIDLTAPKADRFKKNFDCILHINSSQKV